MNESAKQTKKMFRAEQTKPKRAKNSKGKKSLRRKHFSLVGRYCYERNIVLHLAMGLMLKANDISAETDVHLISARGARDRLW